MSNKHKLVVVEWLDSVQPASEWRHLGDTPELEVITCLSVGWVVGENRQVLMLAPNIGDYRSGGGAQGCGFMRIAACAVTKITELADPS